MPCFKYGVLATQQFHSLVPSHHSEIIGNSLAWIDFLFIPLLKGIRLDCGYGSLQYLLNVLAN